MFLPITPKPKGNGREIFWPFKKGGRGKCGACKRPTGHPIVRETRATKSAEKAATSIASLLAPRVPLTGPVRLDCLAVLPIPKSWPKWKQDAALAGQVWPSGNVGDRGNLLKMLEDVLEDAGFFINDCQVCTGLVEKVYGKDPGWLVSLRELPHVESARQWKGLLVSQGVDTSDTSNTRR